MYLENNKVAMAMLVALQKRMAKEHPTVDLPQTQAQLASILDMLRPEGQAYMWRGCREAVAKHLRVPVNESYHTWFDALNRAV